MRTLSTETRFHCDAQYGSLVGEIIQFGEHKTSRGGAIAATYDLFGPQLCFDLRDGFPLLTTKFVDFVNVYHELMWMLQGRSNVRDLKSNMKDDPVTHQRRTIWDPWADKNGECGPIYGVQWRRWEVSDFAKPETAQRDDLNECYFIDQVEDLLRTLKRSPDSRRMIVSAWNPADLDRMALPPCHMMFQVSVSHGFLDLKMYQRSADTALGVPYNIAQYALLAEMLAQECGLQARRFIHTFGSAHIYEHHIDKLKMQMSREPKPMCKIKLREMPFWHRVENNETNDYVLVGYEPHAPINFGKPEV